MTSRLYDDARVDDYSVAYVIYGKQADREWQTQNNDPVHMASKNNTKIYFLISCNH